MVPKLRQNAGFFFYRSVAKERGKKPVTGQLMDRARGRALRQITQIRVYH
jgi:hypothetical protein